jgi:HEAT repeat protein
MPTKEQFLSDIQSDSPDTRFAAWRAAGEVDPEVIPELGRLAASERPGVAKAAREALQTLVHARQGAVAKQVLTLTGTAYTLPVRALAFRLLSLIGGEDAVPAVARFLRDTELREEAVFCLERIPGAVSIKALAGAYKDVPDDFKPRILAALGHRRAAEALPLVTEALRSPNPEIALAAVKAYGRIGKKPASPPRLPDPASLGEWEKIEHMDSLLRWADVQVREGNHADAMKIYQTALARPEEHWQCAALIGIAKMGTAEAATAIFPKLKSLHPKVRITARQAWQSLAGVL